MLHQFKNSLEYKLPPGLIKLPDRNKTPSDGSFNCLSNSMNTDNLSNKVDLQAGFSPIMQMKELAFAEKLQRTQACMSDKLNNLEFIQDNDCRPPGFNSPSGEGIPPGFEHVPSESNLQLKQLSVAEIFEQHIMNVTTIGVPASTEINIHKTILTEQIGEECPSKCNLPVRSNSLATKKSLSPELNIQKQMESPPGFNKPGSKKLSLASQFARDVESIKNQSESDSSSIISDPPDSSNIQHKSRVTSEIQRRVHLASMKKEERMKYLFNPAAANKSQSSDAFSSEYEEVVDYWDGSVIKERKPNQKSKPPTSVGKLFNILTLHNCFKSWMQI
jgi:hypothetical protein